MPRSPPPRTSGSPRPNNFPLPAVRGGLGYADGRGYCLPRLFRPAGRWFVTEAYKITDTGQLVAAAGEQLIKAGIPLWRLAYFQLTLHPELDGHAYYWRRGQQV